MVFKKHTTQIINVQIKNVRKQRINPDIAAHLPGTFDQTNLRKRVVHVTYSDTLNVEDSIYNHATHYTYDIHGNVNTLIQDNPQRYSPGGAITSQRYKRLDYEYDLISGNVNEVAYEKDSADMMLHRYAYDADNRIQTVETSTDNVVWDQDAKYIYYAHGPLARVELGENAVQGVDYAYTLQGWIKGVNSNTLDTTRDMGHDADTLTANVNRLFGKDAFSYSLTYYEGDYAPIDASKWAATVRWEANQNASDLLNAREDLFNGNISAMVTTITDTNGAALPQGMSYNYDQLNRLLDAKAWVNIDVPNNEWDNGFTYANRYYNSFTYDANGNILTQDRYDQAGTQIEDMDYRYARNGAGDMIQNRLYHVNDSVSTGAFSSDIDDQNTFESNLALINTANNYEYDEKGRLVRDSIEEIDTIRWTIVDKVKEIKRTSGSSKKNIRFDYDSEGHRIAKHVFNSSGIWEKSFYYVLDHQGNLVAEYEQAVVTSSMTYRLVEKEIYGAFRLGTRNDTIEMIGAIVDTTNSTHVLGARNYELTNHLGNVLTVISDVIQPKDWNSDGVADNYYATIIKTSDYYPFGVEMEGRCFEKHPYAYGYNGKERDVETDVYDYGFRIYNQLLGRFLSVDPLVQFYPCYSSYQYAANYPIASIDIDGLEPNKVLNVFERVFEKIFKFPQDDPAACSDQNKGESGGRFHFNLKIFYTVATKEKVYPEPTYEGKAKGTARPHRKNYQSKYYGALEINIDAKRVRDDLVVLETETGRVDIVQTQIQGQNVFTTSTPGEYTVLVNPGRGQQGTVWNYTVTEKAQKVVTSQTYLLLGFIPIWHTRKVEYRDTQQNSVLPEGTTRKVSSRRDFVGGEFKRWHKKGQAWKRLTKTNKSGERLTHDR